MDRSILKFLTKILIAALAMVGIAWITFTFIIPDRYLPILPWMLAFFTVVVVSTHAWQVKLAKKDLGRFTRYSMLIAMLRLMLYSVFAIVYLALNQTHAVVFVVSLVVVYSIYTILEVSDLSRVVKRK